ncbi:MAG: hypothetical protein GX434_01680 [Peptococcaceae bacterium]|nr:hypothetical protein [Peptococcaceae bacterium]
MNSVHRHYFQGVSDIAFYHTHRYSGYSSPSENYQSHVHEISGCTTKDDGHRHYYKLITGPNIEINGGHIHSYQGLTTSDMDQCHQLTGSTMVDHFKPKPRLKFTITEARLIGEQLGIDWSRSPFDVEQFRIGLEVELEHGRRDPKTNVTDDDPITTGKIALAHLNEFPDYYTRLTKLEKEAKSFWKKR